MVKMHFRNEKMLYVECKTFFIESVDQRNACPFQYCRGFFTHSRWEPMGAADENDNSAIKCGILASTSRNWVNASHSSINRTGEHLGAAAEFYLTIWRHRSPCEFGLKPMAIIRKKRESLMCHPCEKSVRKIETKAIHLKTLSWFIFFRHRAQSAESGAISVTKHRSIFFLHEWSWPASFHATHDKVRAVFVHCYIHTVYVNRSRGFCWKLLFWILFSFFRRIEEAKTRISCECGDYRNNFCQRAFANDRFPWNEPWINTRFHVTILHKCFKSSASDWRKSIYANVFSAACCFDATLNCYVRARVKSWPINRLSFARLS